MARLLGIGDNTVDIYVDQGVQFPGGNAVNVAVLARRLGAQASYLGCIGSDDFGSLIRDALIAENVDTSHLRIMDAPNSWSRIRHVGTDRVFAGSRPGLRGVYDLKADDFAYIGAHDLVHTSVYSKIEGDLAAIGRVSSCLSFDYSDRIDLDYARTTAPSLDIAFLSDADSDEAACRSLCRDVAALGPRTVVVMRGRKGALGFHQGTFAKQSIAKADPMVDTLGAGDGFIAAFLLTLHHTHSLSAALAHGAENAAHICTYRGAFGHEAAIQPGQPGLAESGTGPPEPRRAAGCENHA